MVVVLPTPVGPTRAITPPSSTASCGATGMRRAEQAQRQEAGAFGAGGFRQLFGDLASQRRIEAEIGQRLQHRVALRMMAAQIVPGHAGQLLLQHPAHAAQFQLHGALQLDEFMGRERSARLGADREGLIAGLP